MDVYFTTFLKRQNSTAVPTFSADANECRLKAPCSVLHPVLELYAVDITVYESVIRTNYAYIPEFHRYYHISNWSFDDNLLICTLEVDVLATYKTAIKGSTQYVLRSSMQYDVNVPDAKYPIKTTAPTRSLGSIQNPLQPAASDYGCFVVGILNNRQSLTGCITYYVMSYLVFMTFCGSLFTLQTNWGSSDTSVSDGVKKALTDPFQYITSVLWLPYSTYDFNSRGYTQTIQSAIPVGYDNVGITGTAYEFDPAILNVEFTNKVTFTIPKHPQRLARGEYLNVSPYSHYYLSFYPFCGEIELDSMALQGKTELSLIYTVDLRTGKGILSICTDYAGNDYTTWLANAPFRVIEAQIGVSIPLASIHTVLPTSLGQMARAAATGVTGFGGFKEMTLKLSSTFAKWIGGTIGLDEGAMAAVYDEIGAEPYDKGDVTDIATNAAAASSTAELIGSQGTISFNSRMPLQFWGMFYTVADEGNLVYGKPLCQYLPLTNFTGFVQCGNPHINAPVGAYKSEVAAIEQYLSTGVILD